MNPFSSHRRGVGLALAAALLFGSSTPVSKVLLRTMEPLWLAGLLYLGSGRGRPGSLGCQRTSRGLTVDSVLPKLKPSK